MFLSLLLLLFLLLLLLLLLHYDDMLMTCGMYSNLSFPKSSTEKDMYILRRLLRLFFFFGWCFLSIPGPHAKSKIYWCFAHQGFQLVRVQFDILSIPTAIYVYTGFLMQYTGWMIAKGLLRRPIPSHPTPENVSQWNLFFPWTYMFSESVSRRETRRR